MKYFILLCLSLVIISCEKYDEDILPIVGVYEANVVGVDGPFSVSISVDYGNNIWIDAPWDGDTWSVIKARVRDEYEYEKKIRIGNQEIDDGVRIDGEGFFFDYTIQLDYTIEIGNERRDFTLIGTKL
ncbi:hypothetical protein [Portibacter lacus]|uniref:Uncharacterized protein n=1 Tax=Portibacter lacus TaxID=1099794 RepID=A0AA37WDE9_9BACT|nr:hypothetical protein [Portibacter lacus]GLR16873.1 hypothetical protein GCM10007940_14880 [Portibacter lacus]